MMDDVRIQMRGELKGQAGQLYLITEENNPLLSRGRLSETICSFRENAHKESKNNESFRFKAAVYSDGR